MTRIEKLKVKPRKMKRPGPCNQQLTEMLSCWASTGDTQSTKECAEAAKSLHNCMRTMPPAQKPLKPTINYHLARLSKYLIK
ncbi:hypothetical protein PIIN_05435 [Serendipita indica DSM 11827]|uniref:37S ribosomal protein mrp10, mitochondrial n=1 Tax=Serendipita indica (strain DSM 11827) TaxID=1109443 RepID=G4TJL7_SERID|nr:hypothetical protein PIIN_05435 [Serendipita indica DSM 11827]